MKEFPLFRIYHVIKQKGFGKWGATHLFPILEVLMKTFQQKSHVYQKFKQSLPSKYLTDQSQE